MLIYHEVLQAQANPSATIVMVHGMHSSLRTFDCLKEKLPADWQVIVVDQKGHGLSAAGSFHNHEYTSEQMAIELKALTDHLKLPRFHLLGHSMGARTAMAFVARYPSHIKSLLLEDMGPEARKAPNQTQHARLREQEKDWRSHSLIWNSKEEIFAALSGMSGNAQGLVESKTKELPDGRWQLLFNPGVAALYGYEGNLTDLTNGLATIMNNHNIPVTFFVADFAVGSAMNQTGLNNIAQMLPAARVVHFPKAWHNIHKSQTEKFIRVLRDEISN